VALLYAAAAQGDGVVIYHKLPTCNPRVPKIMIEEVGGGPLQGERASHSCGDAKDAAVVLALVLGLVRLHLHRLRTQQAAC
jgi:hypothetical protein